MLASIAKLPSPFQRSCLMPETLDHRCYDQLFVGGQWRKPSTDQRLTVISPHTESSIGDVPAATPADVDDAVAAARHAFDHGPWPRLSPQERMRKVEQLATIYGGHLDEMADLITDEMGSPRSFSRLGQAAAAVSMIHLSLAVARDFPWNERRHGVLGEVHLHRAPVGVVAAIVPWNVPQFLIMPKLIPALIAGCPVIVKPAPETPFDALWLAEMIEQLDLPDGVVSVLPGGTDVGEALVRHPGVDKIAFTGSSAVGRRIAALCGDHPRRCRHRQDGEGPEEREPDEQWPGVRGADPHSGQRTASRRGRRRAGRHDVGSACGRPVR